MIFNLKIHKFMNKCRGIQIIILLVKIWLRFKNELAVLVTLPIFYYVTKTLTFLTNL